MLSTCVVYNPNAGRGRAKQLIAKSRNLFGPHAEFRTTSQPWHGVEVACRAAQEGFERVVAAGGDGTVHEVANGLILSGKPQVVLSTFPIGSMNDYGYTTGMNSYWNQPGRYPTEIVPCDVGRITAPGRERFFINSIGTGFTGFVTVESRKIKRLRGLLLYSVALFRAVAFHFRRPMTWIEVDGQSREGPTLTLSVFLGQREGGFPVVPLARNDDGLFDYLFAGQIRWWEVLRYFPALLKGQLPQDHPELQMKTCRTAKIRSERPLCIHADGELFCVPEDGLHEAAMELLPQKLRVEVCPQFRFGQSE